MNNQHSKNPSDVGYGKPPAEHRFTKGKSGNPQGRPAGSVNFNTLLSRKLREKITVTQNGRQKKISLIDAIVHRLIGLGASGDLAAIRLISGLAQGLESAAAVDSQIDSELDNQIMRRLLEKTKI